MHVALALENCLSFAIFLAIELSECIWVNILILISDVDTFLRDMTEFSLSLALATS